MRILSIYFFEIFNIFYLCRRAWGNRGCSAIEGAGPKAPCRFDQFGYGAGALDGFVDFLGNQTARVVIVILLVVSGDITGLHGVQPGGACQIRIGLCYPLAEGIVSVGVVRSAAGKGAAGQPGQLAFAPCGGHAVVTGGTAHGVVGNAAAAEAGQLVRTVAKGSGGIAAAGGGVQGIVVGLDAGQVANIIIRINKGFCKPLIILPHQLSVLIVGVAFVIAGSVDTGMIFGANAAQVIIGVAIGAEVCGTRCIRQIGNPGFCVIKVFDEGVGINQGGFLGQPLVGIEGVGCFCLLGAADHRQEKSLPGRKTVWEARIYAFNLHR